MTTPTRLSAAFRADQIDVAQQAARELIEVMGALNLQAVDASAPGWFAAMESVIVRQHRRSTRLGRTLYSDYRVASGIDDLPITPSIPVLDRNALRGALTLAGPYAAKHAMSLGHDVASTYQTVLSYSTGVAVRAALSGGRNAVQETAIRDQVCSGYMRVTSGKPCPFCAMVAQNTYSTVTSASQSSGTRTRAFSPQPPRSSYHDHCKCTVVPIFSAASWPDGYREQAAEYRDIWIESSAAGGTDQEKRDRFTAAFYERYPTS